MKSQPDCMSLLHVRVNSTAAYTRTQTHGGMAASLPCVSFVGGTVPHVVLKVNRFLAERDCRL